MRGRLQKILSEYGVCSRRRAEELIAGGRVTLNGEIAAPGRSADTDTDKIAVDGVPLESAPQKVYILLNKPRGYIASAADDRGRKTVLDLVADCGARVYPVGRLDRQSEGVIFLTNDGEFANSVAHPSGRHSKTHRVSVRGDLTGAVKRLSEPFDIDGYTTYPATVRVLSRSDVGGVLEITISEGRNRQVRRMCEQCGLEVSRLIRVSEAGIGLGGLGPGAWRYLTNEEVSAIMDRNRD